MTILGYFLALVMGFVLGLIGAGGSIFTVPILVYLFKIKPTIATGYSLLIVGVTAFIGTIRFYKKQQAYLKIALLFGLPSMISMMLTRAYILPAIPDKLITIHSFILYKDMFIMVLFACLMLFAGFFMLKPNKQVADITRSILSPMQFFIVVVISSGIGFLTGVVGSGGGFIIVPALMALFKLPIKTAIGTSLAVITLNSLTGFSSDWVIGVPMDWSLLGIVIAFALIGVGLGTYSAQIISDRVLRLFFGVLILFVGTIIIVKELVFT